MNPTTPPTPPRTTEQPGAVKLHTLLIRVARAAHAACDNAEESRAYIHLERDDYEELSKSLDELDALPNPPDEEATGPRKAEYLLALLRAASPTTAPGSTVRPASERGTTG